MTDSSSFAYSKRPIEWSIHWCNCSKLSASKQTNLSTNSCLQELFSHNSLYCLRPLRVTLSRTCLGRGINNRKPRFGCHFDILSMFCRIRSFEAHLFISKCVSGSHFFVGYQIPSIWKSLIALDEAVWLDVIWHWWIKRNVATNKHA